MQKFLLEWRQDSFNLGHYDAALFVGDKLVALADEPKHILWLAQVHFNHGDYARALSLLSSQDLISGNPSCQYLAGYCLIKQDKIDEALSILGEHNPTHLISGASKRKPNARTNPGLSRTASEGGQGALASDSEMANRRYEAAMCYLRGLCYAKQNAFDRAKECYKDAVRINILCFEAFRQLVKNSLMSPDEEEEFLESLDFDSIRGPGDDPEMGDDEPAEYVHMLYQTQLSKFRNPRAFNTAVESLSTHYGLADNADLLLARADLFYTQCRFQDALSITSSILERDKYNFSVYPLHLACLYELKKTNSLFLISHDLADHHPEEPCTWLAVGIYYFATDRIAEARRYFSKASMMDPHFGPAWIGFAHTFAAEGEHDQAVSAYSTAARLFMGTHLPQVFLGMQQHAMNNMTAAEEFLKTAYGLCKTDPLLLNEMGIVMYHQNRLKEAASFFTEALKTADVIGSDPQAWLGSRTNLAHTYRRLRLFKQALEEFDVVLREGGKDASIFSAKGLIFMDMGKPDEAVQLLHEALAIHPQDPVATELLNKAIEEAGGLGGITADEDEELAAFDAELDQRKQAARLKLQGKTSGPNGKGKGVNRLPMVSQTDDEKGESYMDMADDE
ncbi:hypothetical protein VTK73DRAFT_7395 [Phialemonium thermophilum]|uniref:Anaphase-promoting complex subunit 6 n=1 Tax=Phialemonium thermophilum TaxID=223376 RepID=A0ABR3XSU0_9PEZI